MSHGSSRVVLLSNSKWKWSTVTLVILQYDEFHQKCSNCNTNVFPTHIALHHPRTSMNSAVELDFVTMISLPPHKNEAQAWLVLWEGCQIIWVILHESLLAKWSIWVCILRSCQNKKYTPRTPYVYSRACSSIEKWFLNENDFLCL